MLSTAHHPHIVVIGSGLGGLTTAVVLAKNGYRVTVLEQERQAGGCLQCFRRRGVKFETGMHFIGSALPDQSLDRLFHYLEMGDDVKLSQLDTKQYNVIGLGGHDFVMGNGREAFIEGLAKDFPTQRDALDRYYALVQKVAGASSLHSLRHAESDDVVSKEYLTRSVNEVIDSTVSDPLLANVLVGDLPLYAAEKGKTPFATHAFIRDFYDQSAFRVIDGSDHIAQALIVTLQRYGGEVLTGHRVTRILCDATHATGIEVNGEEYFEADYIISDAHPIRTLELTDSALIRPAYRHRVNAMPQTVGCFTLYLDFKPQSVPYMNYNYFGYQGASPWDCEQYTADSWPRGYLYMHFCHEAQPRWAQSGQIISYMNISDVLPWKDTTVGHRGADYEALKRRKADQLLQCVEQRFPGLRGCIAHCYTSTPLTYLDYTGTAAGSMYGIAKDIGLGAGCRVSHRTRIPNLFLTGQNINSHGMLGVMVGTIVTCSEFLTAEKIYQQIQSCTDSGGRNSQP